MNKEHNTLFIQLMHKLILKSMQGQVEIGSPLHKSLKIIAADVSRLASNTDLNPVKINKVRKELQINSRGGIAKAGNKQLLKAQADDKKTHETRCAFFNDLIAFIIAHDTKNKQKSASLKQNKTELKKMKKPQLINAINALDAEQSTSNKNKDELIQILKELQDAQ